MKSFIEPLIENETFHIYNRGIDKKPIFLSDKHYKSFLWKYQKLVSPYVDTYAYCLLGNHFHLLIRIKNEQEIDKIIAKKELKARREPVGLFISRQLSHLFNSHAQSFNRATDRTGGLFDSPFRRKIVDSTGYLTHLIKYIHLNPVKHEIYGNFEFYPHSSYKEYKRYRPRFIDKKEIIDLFGSFDLFEQFHQNETSEKKIINLLLE